MPVIKIKKKNKIKLIEVDDFGNPIYNDLFDELKEDKKNV